MNDALGLKLTLTVLQAGEMELPIKDMTFMGFHDLPLFDTSSHDDVRVYKRSMDYNNDLLEAWAAAMKDPVVKDSLIAPI